MKTTTPNEGDAIPIEEKDALHNAGVDVGTGAFTSLASDQDKKEIDETVVPDVVDIDSGIPDAGDSDLAKTGIQFVDQNPVPSKTDLSSLAEKKRATLDSKDLEDEFKSQFSDSKIAGKESGAVEIKTSSLSSLLAKIQDKLGVKKKSVKEELVNLKRMKDTIGKDIEDIKELEESEEKIKTEVAKIESIKAEVDSIEREVGEELKN